MKFLSKIQTIALVLVLIAANLMIIPQAHAATLTNSSVIEMGGTSNASPMIVGDGQSLAIAFTTVGATAVNPSITLTFTGWSGGANGTVNTTQSISNTGCQALTGATSGLPGTLAASGTGAVLTISSSGGSNSLSATHSYCTELTSTTAVTNPTAGGVYSVTINDGTDSQTDGIDVLTAGANAYSITGTVAPTFTMSQTGGGTDTFPTNLSAFAVTASNGITTTINTNAASGWFVWAEDANSPSGLHSTQASTTIPSVATGSNVNMGAGGDVGSADYALGIAPAGGANAATNYVYTSSHGGGLQSTTYNEVAYGTAAANAVTFVSHELADISPTTPPATDYTDTITMIGAGSF
jgi:hypothetical protein